MDELLSLVPHVLLASSRVAGMTAVSPMFGGSFLLPPMRVFFTFLLAVLMLPLVEPAADVTEGAGLLVGCVLELLVGLMLGFLSRLIFSVVQMAGAMMDMDMGFTMANVVNPANSQPEPILSTFFHNLALLLYFLLNAHHWLLRALADSYVALPVGGLLADSVPLMYVVSIFGALMGSAVKMVLPFVAVMMMSTAVLAALNRAVQQIQIFHVGYGLKTVLGFTTLMLMMPFFLGFVQSLFDSGYLELLRFIQLLRPGEP